MNTVERYTKIEIQLDTAVLKGNLRISKDKQAIILFSHGSGSSRLSTRNNYVADVLLANGFSSLLFDLLTKEEDLIYENRFDIELLTERLMKVTQWIRNYPLTKKLDVGYFGASTGAASALNAASHMNHSIKAIVCRGGRPDLAMNILNKVYVPTLLLVGANDSFVLNLNKQAQSLINGICELDIIEGASHLFEEPGTLDVVAKLSSDWFNKYLN